MYNKSRVFFLTCLIFISFHVSLSAGPTFWRESSTKILDAGWGSVQTTLPNGTTAIFYSDAYHIYIATSSDGLTFTEKAYLAVSTSTNTNDGDSKKITSCAVTQLPSLQYRMFYAAVSSSDVYRIMSSTSTDMLTWGKSSSWGPFMTGNGSTFIDSPFILKTTTYWYLYYTRDSNGGNNADDYIIAYATSTDSGDTWTEVNNRAITDQAKDPQVLTLSDGTYRMYYVGDTTAGADFGAIRTATSSDLLTFTTDSSAVVSRSSTDDTLSHPRAVKLTDAYTYRMYYGYTLASATTPYMLTAKTTAPFLISISPASGVNTGTADFTITGEIFSPAVSVKLSYTNQPDITATGVSRTNDTTITGAFDLTSQITKKWDVTVTNSTGVSATMANAFEIQGAPVPAGTVDISENVFNPTTIQRAAINYTIFSDGKVTIKIYTMIGELVKKLIDRDDTAGTYTENWDGKNKHGDMVASGIYLVHIQAPGIDKVKKIAVVK